MEDAQTPGNDAVEENFPADADGWLYKMQPWFEFAPELSGTTLNFANQAWVTLNNYTTTGGAKKKRRAIVTIIWFAIRRVRPAITPRFIRWWTRRILMARRITSPTWRTLPTWKIGCACLPPIMRRATGILLARKTARISTVISARKPRNIRCSCSISTSCLGIKTFPGVRVKIYSPRMVPPP